MAEVELAMTIPLYGEKDYLLKLRTLERIEWLNDELEERGYGKNPIHDVRCFVTGRGTELGLNENKVAVCVARTPNDDLLWLSMKKLDPDIKLTPIEWPSFEANEKELRKAQWVAYHYEK